MNITINNLSSPGAQFSEHTNSIILKAYDWIVKHNYPIMKYSEFRSMLSKDENINSQNYRNISALLKNCGMLDYQAGEDIDTKDYFTQRGEGYVNAIILAKEIPLKSLSPISKREAIANVELLKSEIICKGLETLLENNETKYCAGIRWFLMFLANFRSINRTEFALMVYTMPRHPIDWYDNLKEIIENYRNGSIDINVSVAVRDDTNSGSHDQTRLVDIQYFTCYGYYASIIEQAGLSKKSGDSYNLNVNKINIIEKLIGLSNND